MTMKNRFNEEDMKAFAPSEKIGLVATVNAAGQPHMSLLTSIMTAGPDKVVVGEFCRGESKANMERNKNVAFAVLTLDRKLWRGKAKWTHLMKEGPEYEIYNNQPMFRYNTYFGINTVHYLDLIEVSEKGSLPMGAIVKSALLTKLAKKKAAGGSKERVLNYFSEALFNRMDSLSFISYVAEDGFPVIVPAVQCQAAGPGSLAFHPGAFGGELRKIAKGATVAVWCASMQMENVLTRGTFRGFRRYGGVTLGAVDIDWVYNSMPSNHGQIYPELPLKPVVEF